jgi:hypothetical protein
VRIEGGTDNNLQTTEPEKQFQENELSSQTKGWGREKIVGGALTTTTPEGGNLTTEQTNENSLSQTPKTSEEEQEIMPQQDFVKPQNIQEEYEPEDNKTLEELVPKEPPFGEENEYLKEYEEIENPIIKGADNHEQETEEPYQEENKEKLEEEFSGEKPNIEDEEEDQVLDIF